jgi:transcriptional regulator with XRE-family HTH domain
MTKHPLADWIEANTTQAQFARDAQCSESHLSLILKGQRGVSLSLAQRLSDVTGGNIPPKAFIRTSDTETAS